MKTIRIILISTLLISLFFACKEEDENLLPDLLGTWVSSNNSDTLIFSSDQKLEILFNISSGSYEYSITADSLTIQYIGPDKILVQPITNSYNFGENILTINFNTDYYPDINQGNSEYQKR